MVIDQRRIQPHLQGGVQVFHGVVHEEALLVTAHSPLQYATLTTLPLFEIAESAYV
jgi:hypothetical protein